VAGPVPERNQGYSMIDLKTLRIELDQARLAPRS
jgi:hypothetical protein